MGTRTPLPLRFEGGTRQAEGETDWYAWIKISVLETGETISAYENGPHDTQELAREAMQEAKALFTELGPTIDMQELRKRREKKDGEGSVENNSDRPGKYLH